MNRISREEDEAGKKRTINEGRGGSLKGRGRGTGGGTWKEGMGVAYLPRYTNHELAPASPSFKAPGVIFTPTVTNHNPPHPRG